MESFSRAEGNVKGYCRRGWARGKDEKRFGGGDDAETLLSFILIYQE